MPTIRLTRQRLLALLMLGVVLLMALGALSIPGNTTTTLVFDQRGLALTFPTQASVLVVALLVFVFSAVALRQPLADLYAKPKRGMNWAALGLGVGAALLVPTILILAAQGGSTNFTSLIAESFRLATPIAIGAMAGIWSERSGVVNIAIEGMMLTGACIGFTVMYTLRTSIPPDSFWAAQTVGVLAAILAGGAAALLHAWLSITFATDQIVSGTVINILALGITSFIRREVLASTEASLSTLPTLPLPILSELPVVGSAFFSNKPIFYLMFVVIIGTHIALFYTRWGLRVRAVGEHPSAADTVGINVNRVRWISVILSGMIAGLAGAWLSIEATGSFNDGMTSGVGFIALAAMIFGKWMPFGAFGGALLFGFSSALGSRFQIVGVPIPYQFLQMVPYILTLVVLAGLVGRATPPKAIGTPYKKE
ncbi:MAG: ABC transporter permease [Anaerolineae bacterium]|nr:ABC transporter permease [Anaerolineae bacterium]MDW8171582.1 ABC transporter permease [Anaerolineae bacterium]